MSPPLTEQGRREHLEGARQHLRDAMDLLFEAGESGLYADVAESAGRLTRTLEPVNVEHVTLPSGVTVIRRGQAGGRDVKPGGCR